MKRILVTGANKGIGLATVAKLLRDYDDTFVVLGSRDARNADNAIEKLLTENPLWQTRLHYLEIDVSSDASVAMASEQLKASFSKESQPLYGIINNAGIANASLGSQAILDVNVQGIKRVCDAFIPLVDANKGRIANVTSAAGPSYVQQLDEASQQLLTNNAVTWDQILHHMDDYISEENARSQSSGIGSAYGISKACANALTLHLARENPHLMINACTPGYIETDLTKPLLADGRSAIDAGMKQPEEGAAASVFLIMDEPKGSGMYFGSDCLRSPMHYYRAPGSPAYTGVDA